MASSDRTTGGSPAAGDKIKPSKVTKPSKALPSEAVLARWNKRLLNNTRLVAVMKDRRGLTVETLEKFCIGHDGHRYTIPVIDGDEKLVNVRRYDPDADSNAKVISWGAGYGSPARWFGLAGLVAADPTALVVVCEGELDALLAQQEFDAAGVPAVAVSGTGGAGTPPADVEAFRDRAVAVLYDCDDAGRKGAHKLAERLFGVAKSVRVVELGLDDSEDVTDWFVTHGRTVADLMEIIDGAADFEPDGPRRPSDELLREAVEAKVKDGSRNAAGFWLACQLRDERYTRAEAEPVMRAYAEAVTGTKPEPYPETEAMTSLESAYSRPPRTANGKHNDDASRYDWDDIGNAQRLVDTHGPDMRFVGAYGGWHVWDGRRWVLDYTGFTMRWVKETARQIRREADRLFEREPEKGAAMLRFAKTSASFNKLKAMLALAESELGIAIPAAEFDRNPALLTVQNGVLVLGEDEVAFREHRRDDYGRLLLPVDFDPEADAPRWREFIAQAIPDEEVRQYVQRLAGYSLMAGNPERKLVFLIGPSSTGKTTFVETLGAVLGDYASSFNLTLFRSKKDEAPRPDLLSALTKRFLFTSEASGEWSLHADEIKKITGEDTMSARGMKSNLYISRVPAFTPWIATNAAPRISAADPALWKRLVVIPFRQVALAEDVGLRSRIVQDEASGVLRWLVDGWNDYKRYGLDEMPAVVVEETMRLRVTLSPVDAWLEEETDRDPAAKAPSEALWESYDRWQKDAGLPKGQQISKMQLWPALDARSFKPAGRHRVPGGGENKVNFRRGLSLRETDDGGVRVIGPRESGS